jgi:hypothetical protein
VFIGSFFNSVTLADVLVKIAWAIFNSFFYIVMSLIDPILALLKVPFKVIFMPQISSTSTDPSIRNAKQADAQQNSLQG